MFSWNRFFFFFVCWLFIYFLSLFCASGRTSSPDRDTHNATNTTFCSMTMFYNFQEQKITYTDMTSTRRFGTIASPRLNDPTSSSILTNKITDLPSSSSPRFEWKFGPWGECSVPCGEKGGKKIRTVRCIDTASDYKLVEDHYCDQLKRPDSMQHQCNAFRCPQWNWGPFGNVNTQFTAAAHLLAHLFWFFQIYFFPSSLSLSHPISVLTNVNENVKLFVKIIVAELAISVHLIWCRTKSKRAVTFDGEPAGSLYAIHTQILFVRFDKK